MTALSKLSKACTTFLSDPQKAGAAALATDISQHRTNLANNTTYVSEAASARTALGFPRSISVVVDATNASSGTLIEHSNVGSPRYQLRISGGAAQARENGVTVVQVILPGMIASARKVLIHWAQR